MSKLESKTYEKLRDNKLIVFRLKDVSLLLHLDKTSTYNLIKAMKKKAIIKKISGSSYAFSDADDLVIACNAHFPSYISFWTALSYYHWSDQLPKKIYLCTTKYSKEINRSYYATIRKNRFFGYTQIGEIVIAEKEKAIIDSLFLPRYAGGIAEIQKCVNISLPQLDMEKLIRYTLQMENKALLRRIGFLIEKHLSESLLRKMKQQIGKGYELLDPTLPKKNNYNKEWLLDVNL